MRPCQVCGVSVCPVCELAGGFHDAGIHADRIVPRRLLKDAGWHLRKGVSKDGESRQ